MVNKHTERQNIHTHKINLPYKPISVIRCTIPVHSLRTHLKSIQQILSKLQFCSKKKKKDFEDKNIESQMCGKMFLVSESTLSSDYWGRAVL